MTSSRTPHLVGLTFMQSRAYAYIWHCLQAGTSPTYDEIAIHLGVVSRGNVARMVGCLIERGYVRKRRYSARSLYLAPDAPAPVGPASPDRNLTSQIAFASPLIDDLRAQAERENREVSALLEDAVALYLGRAACQAVMPTLTGAADGDAPTITDEYAFARGVLAELQRAPNEEGRTPVHALFERAALEAAEAGCDGIRYPGEE